MVIVQTAVERDNVLQTIRPDGKKGIRLSASLYEQVSAIIVDHVKKSPAVMLANIIDHAKVVLNSEPDIELLTLHVKLDLESKGYIETIRSRSARKRGLLRITGKGWRYFRQGK